MTVAKKDAITKERMRDPVAFADVFNVFLYNGEQVIKPEELHPMDTAEIVLPHARDKASVHMQRTRDVLKEWATMTDGRVAYCLLGVENQSEVNYAMPIRSLLYDVMSLIGQVRDIANKHKAERAESTSAEYLSGLHKDDTVLPVVTLVIYWGDDDWDGALSLRELYGDVDEAVLRYAADYHVNLISPKILTPEKLQEFRSSLRQIFTYIKYSQDKDRLRTVLEADVGFADMSRQDIELINAITGSKIKLPSGKERVNMCKAIEDMLDEARSQGINQGINQMCKAMDDMLDEARSQGISQGVSQGISQGQERFAFNALKRYVRRDIAITEDVLADVAEDSEMSIDKLRHLATKNGISLA